MVFKGIDAKLNIYALANGMDLDKGEGHRRLGWYRDGRDRGVALVDDGTERIRVEAWAWNGDPETADRVTLGEPQAPEALMESLSTILEEATESANGL